MGEESSAWLATPIGGMALYYFFMLKRGAAGRLAANFYQVPGVVALLGWSLPGESLTPLAMGAWLWLGVWLTESS